MASLLSIHHDYSINSQICKYITANITLGHGCQKPFILAQLQALVTEVQLSVLVIQTTKL